MAVLAFRCQHSLAPSYFLDEIRRPSDVDCRRRLQSALTAALILARSTEPIGDRVCPIAAAKVWNTLPVDGYLRRHSILQTETENWTF